MKRTGRTAGAERRNGFTGKPVSKPIYGSTPRERVGGNSSQRIGKEISGCNPKAHIIGEPRK